MSSALKLMVTVNLELLPDRECKPAEVNISQHAHIHTIKARVAFTFKIIKAYPAFTPKDAKS